MPISLHALRHSVCEHAEQTDGGELLREQAKQRDELGEQPLHPQCFVGLFGLGFEVNERQIPVYFTHRLAHGGDQRAGSAGGANLDGCAQWRWLLAPGRINRRRDFVALVGVFGILGKADDFDFIRSPRIEGEALADRIFIGEILPGEGLIDHDHAGRAEVVLPPKVASGQERDFHRFQKVFAHLMMWLLPVGLILPSARGRAGQRAAQIELRLLELWASKERA